jgi:hypothetical protein
MRKESERRIANKALNRTQRSTKTDVALASFERLSIFGF